MIDNITRLRNSFLIKNKEQKINKMDYVILLWLMQLLCVVERYHREMSKLE